jgi:orotate phosphoribosyltransferase
MPKPLCFTKAYFDPKTDSNRIQLESHADMSPDELLNGLIEIYGKHLGHDLKKEYRRDSNLIRVFFKHHGDMEVVNFSDKLKRVNAYLPDGGAFWLHQYVNNYALKREPVADKELIAKHAADIHWQAGLIRVRTNTDDLFTVDGGKNRSPYYIDERLLTDFPAQNRIITAYMAAILDSDKIKFDFIAGAEASGISPATSLAKELNVPLIWVRKNGTIEGAHKYEVSGKQVLLVDDVIAQGRSKLNVVKALKAIDAKVSDCIVIADRLEGGGTTLKETGVNLHSVTDFDTISEVGFEKEHIDPSEWREIQLYHQNPAAWHKEHKLKYYKI